MNKRIKFVFLFIILFNVGFCSLFHREPKYCAYLDKITNKFTKEVKQRYEFIYGGGGGSLMDNVKQVNLYYNYNYKLSIEEARKLAVESCERLLEMINDDKKIRPFLSHYPFTIKGIAMTMGATPLIKRSDPEKKSVAHIYIYNGKIHYSYYDCEKGRLENLYKEPYNEALQIVQKQNESTNPQIHEI